MNLFEISKNEFEEKVMKNNKPVLVTFFADWCGPCKMQAVVLKEYAPEREDVDFVRINIDTNRELAMEYGVMSIPTLMLVKNGEVQKVEPGFKQKAQLTTFIDN